MATMSYCAFENTASDMRICIEKLDNTADLEDLDQHERNGFFYLRRMAIRFLEDSERFVDDSEEK